MVVWNVAKEIRPAAVPTVLEFVKRAPDAATPPADRLQWFRLQENAITLLGYMGPNAREAVPTLVEAMGSKGVSCRRKAIETLGLIGPDAQAAVPALQGALQEDDPWVRLNAVVALARISPREESHVLAVARFLKDPDAPIRIAAVRALGDLGARASSTIPDLRQLAEDDDDASVIREVITALEAIEADLARPVGE